MALRPSDVSTGVPATKQIGHDLLAPFPALPALPAVFVFLALLASLPSVATLRAVFVGSTMPIVRLWPLRRD